MSPEDVRAYADDLFRSAWESYHPDGGLRDWDDRIRSLGRVIDELQILEQKIRPSPGRDAMRAVIEESKERVGTLWKALINSQFSDPYRNVPRFDFPSFREVPRPLPFPSGNQRIGLTLEQAGSAARQLHAKDASMVRRNVQHGNGVLAASSGERPTAGATTPSDISYADMSAPGGLLGTPLKRRPLRRR